MILALENKYQGQVEFIVVDVDDPQGQELAQTFAVNSIPAFFFIDKEKNIAQQVIGTQPLETMDNLMKTILK